MNLDPHERHASGLLRAGACLACFLLLYASTAHSKSAPKPEYEVKAAYLLNFSRYVHWPDAAFAGPIAPFVICILGEDPFGGVLDGTVATRTSRGRPIQVRRLEHPDQAVGCHLLFVGRNSEQWRAALDQVRGQPVLTVGESRPFLRGGGGIELLIVDETVQFGVNLNAVADAGLTVSSRMLSLARKVLGTIDREALDQ